jgi:hypothetical protein
MQGEDHSCLWHRAIDSRGPATCVFVNPGIHRECRLWYRMCELHDLAPNLWGKIGEDFCCHEWQRLFLRCAEDSGHRQGAFDVIVHPNDGKVVWRNFERLRFTYCLFCGREVRPSPEDLRANWEALEADNR